MPAATLGGVMSRESLVLHILAASFWVVSPAFGQNFNLPDGPGKETNLIARKAAMEGEL